MGSLSAPTATLVARHSLRCAGRLYRAVAIGAQNYLPWDIPELVGADAVDSILNIIASSMLAVTTFSLSTMTAAYSAATTNVTPRATPLLIEDKISQRVLSTFVGSFLFSIVGIIVLKTGAYGPSGRSVLFAVTVIVVLIIVINLLRWIDHLTRLGRVGETTGRVEDATREAIEYRLAAPYLGGVELLAENKPSDDALLIRAGGIGHLQHIDMPSLSDLAEKLNSDIYLPCNPGAFLSEDTILAWLERRAGDADGLADEIRESFTLGADRSFDQDPRFGLAVMSEIGSRALSPATNDPGTALDAISRNARLLAIWSKGSARSDDYHPDHPRIHVAPLLDDDLFEDAFMLMARDGAGLIEIQLRLNKCLFALSTMGGSAFAAAARRQADMAFARGQEALSYPGDKDRIREERQSTFGMSDDRNG